MSSDCSLHLSEAACRDKISSTGQQLKEAGGHMHLEGWMKQPRLERERIHSQRKLQTHRHDSHDDDEYQNLQVPFYIPVLSFISVIF